ncbi:hypothetical protein [Streptomyces sp. NPDC085466]|uniref:hypothetical protein n=1 Tax=Streptomyces sp. NPDC085466 TaxID=3365725 RepID=UPI0037CF287C
MAALQVAGAVAGLAPLLAVVELGLPDRELYRRVAFVFQDVRLVRASVADNIALAVPEAGREAVERAARLAYVHDRVVRLPRGYDSVIGEDARLWDARQASPHATDGERP